MQRILIYLAAMLGISGCGPINTGYDKDIDPYKATNQEIFKLNQSIDKNIVKPIAKIYDYLLPDYIDARISMFFSNLGEISVISNDLLQAKFHAAFNDTTRLLINSSFGMFGMFDMASENGFPKHSQSFALTLDHWGFKQSPYIIVPIFGASTIFDSFSLPVDNLALSPIAYTKPYSLAMTMYVTAKVNLRASAMPYDKIILDSFDPYLMVRDAYLQKRQQIIAVNAKLD